MNAHQTMIRLAYHLAEIDKNLNVFSNICIIQDFHKTLDINEKRHQVALFARKILRKQT